MSIKCIAVDAMGGDHGPSITVPAAIDALERDPNIKIILVGNKDIIEKNIEATNIIWDKSRLSIVHASQVVAMDELPSYALRSKKDSSMRVALNLVKSGDADACVSSGNTGALMATARFVLKMLPGIDRPAILFPLPSMTGVVRMLDLGANVECQAEHLFQFAVMGSVLTAAVTNNPKPSVGLLNVGKEEIKGTDTIKKASVMLSNTSDLNYVGYVEGDDIYKGTSDVVVCDGFAGNVALKTSEGLAQMIMHFMKEKFTENWLTKLCALITKPVLKSVLSQFDTNKYNGGNLLGLNGVVVKSHGGAKREAFAVAIKNATLSVERNVTEKIKLNVAKALNKQE